jgi:hypothetical protein
MRLPLALPLAAAALAAVATPSSAMLTPYCATRLVAAAPGEAASCSTQTLATLQGNPYRTVTVAVAQGTVDVSLRCPLTAPAQTVRVTGPRTATLEAFDNGYTCTATLVAVTDGATALLASTHGNKNEPIVHTAPPALPMESMVCTTNLVNAAKGTPASCATKGPGPLGNRNVFVRRLVTIEVAAGTADVTLTCGSAVHALHVSGPQPRLLNDDGGGDCRLDLVAADDNTTAVVTSTFHFVIVLD